ncbi:hypothetical protein RLIN73S_01725 [Rhodanobacter lindaniclasticus]
MVVVRRRVAIGGRGDGPPDIAHADGRATLVGKHDILERLRMDDLIVRGDREARRGGIDRAFGGVGGGRDQRRAHLFERQPDRREPAGVGLHPDRRLLRATQRNLGHARYLRDLARQEVVDSVGDGSQRQRVGTCRQHQDRCIRRVQLLVGWRRGHRPRQVVARCRDRRLHVLRRRVDVAIKVELDGNRRRPHRAERGHVADPGDLAQLALQRRGHRRRHGLRAGPGERRRDLDGRRVDLWQRGDGQQGKRDDAGQGHRRHQQYRGDRPRDERRGQVHGVDPCRGTAAEGRSRREASLPPHPLPVSAVQTGSRETREKPSLGCVIRRAMWRRVVLRRGALSTAIFRRRHCSLPTTISCRYHKFYLGYPS